jgi:hypothetical protein
MRDPLAHWCYVPACFQHDQEEKDWKPGPKGLTSTVQDVQGNFKTLKINCYKAFCSFPSWYIYSTLLHMSVTKSVRCIKDTLNGPCFPYFLRFAAKQKISQAQTVLDHQWSPRIGWCMMVSYTYSWYLHLQRTKCHTGSQSNACVMIGETRKESYS